MSKRVAGVIEVGAFITTALLAIGWAWTQNGWFEPYTLISGLVSVAIDLYRRYWAESEPEPSQEPTQPIPVNKPISQEPTQPIPVNKPISIVKKNDRNRKRRATPSLGPQRETIRERSAKEIVDNLKGIKSSEFHKKVKDLYIGRWTQEPGWQASVKRLPSKLSGEHWFCSLKEVGSDTIIHAFTVQDVSMLRIGDTFTVSGRIRDVSRDECVSLEDAEVQSDDVSLA